MEFGLFLNGYLPGPAAHDPEAEHTMLMREVQYAIHADGFNWKYVWIGEHHGLVEYSHMSAPEVVFGYIAAKTSQIHMGSGIMNLSRPVNHPVRNAERVAMLDHITGGRYEGGTGRGAGSHEMATFDLLTSETKAMCDEAAPESAYLAKAHVPRDRMWVAQNYPSTWRDYPYRGDVQQVGDAWSRSHQSLAAQVPSALCDESCNVVINPEHVDAPLIQGLHVSPIRIDPRLRRATGG